MILPRKRWFLPLSTSLLFLFAASLERRVCAQAPEDKRDSSPSQVRPCVSRQVNSKANRKDKGKGKTEANSPESPLACVEAKDSPLNIQEFFQSYVRAQTWPFGEERIVADGWMFARYLGKEELLQFAKEGRFAGQVTWTGGKAVVFVSTRELDEGYTRTEVTVHIQGFGENVDRFAPARDTWDLDSTGLLEKNLITALQDHFKSLHSSPQV